MTLRIHIFVLALISFSSSAESQKISKADKAVLAELQTHMQSLAADTVGGLGMGMPGEKATADYIISELSKSGVRPKGDNNGWLQNFTIDLGRQVAADALFSVDDKPLVLTREWFPLTICPAGQVTGSPAIALPERGVPWFADMREMLEAGVEDTHFDLIGAIRAKAAACAKKGATALILYNTSSRRDKLFFDAMNKPEAAVIPVIYITRDAKRKYLKDESASVDLKIRISYTEQKRSGHNVVGVLDNGAATTAIVGTGYANPSGIAGMLELAHLLAASKLHGNNYLFVVFSGSEMGSAGAKSFAAHPAGDAKRVNYLLGLGLLGSMNDTTHALYLGGRKTANDWFVVTGDGNRERKGFLFQDDSSSIGGDPAVFYKQQVPVLTISTGPEGQPLPASAAAPAAATDRVNYPGELQAVKYIFAVIEASNGRGKLSFTP